MVYFIGAGPGDPELITVKAFNLLKTAKCVIYAGSLINREILNTAPNNCIVHNSAEMTLEQIIDVMLENEKSKIDTLRLHTGDPSIFSAVREQADALNRHKINYQIIPGVSSFSAASAALKKEMTLPGVSQTIIITREEGKTPVPKSQSLEILAKIKASLAIFLSVDKINDIVKKLIPYYGEKAFVSVVYKASWKDEKIIKGTLADISEKVITAEIKKTAIIFVGDFLGNDYQLSKLYDKNFSHEFRKKI